MRKLASICIRLSAFLAAAFILASCGGGDDPINVDPEKPGQSNKADLNSFVLPASSNSGLSENVIAYVSGNEIKFSIPEGMDPAKLVPSISVSDKAVVKLDGKDYKNGDPYDFTSQVVMTIVSESGKTTKTYSVRWEIGDNWMDSYIWKLMDECKAMGIKVLGPDVNESGRKFGVNARGDVRFGLAAVKGVGENAVQSIIDERAANGPYKDIFDFVQRVNLSACNRKNIECLAMAGAFDCFGEIRREQFMEPCGKGETFADVLVRYGNKYQCDRMESQFSLFGDMGMTACVQTPVIPDAPEWSALDRLNREKDLVGIYISAHPLDEYRVILDNICTVGMAAISEKSKLVGRDLIFGGVVISMREGRTKTGKPYGITVIEDFTGSGEIALFGEPWLQWRNMMVVGNFLFIRGICQPGRYDPNRVDLTINSIELLQDVKDKVINSMTIDLPLSVLDKELVSDLDTLTAQPGNVTLKFNLKNADTHVSLSSAGRKINVTPELVNYLKEVRNLDVKFNC